MTIQLNWMLHLRRFIMCTLQTLTVTYSILEWYGGSGRWAWQFGSHAHASSTWVIHGSHTLNTSRIYTSGGQDDCVDRIKGWTQNRLIDWWIQQTYGRTRNHLKEVGSYIRWCTNLQDWLCCWNELQSKEIIERSQAFTLTCTPSNTQYQRAIDVPAQ